MQEYVRPMYGLDASRRVAWARYYEKCEELEEVRRALQHLSMLVLTHQRIHSEDQIIEIAKNYNKLTIIARHRNLPKKRSKRFA
jgi:hypothetical protein